MVACLDSRETIKRVFRVNTAAIGQDKTAASSRREPWGSISTLTGMEDELRAAN